jgi:photosystem II stability/assembly factor-like uncharacterized protein
MRLAIFLTALLVALPAAGQWEIQAVPSTADLRGVHALGNGVVWASGTEGTVLRTVDDGKTWQRCVTPPDAEKLDFRGVQAFDGSTAIVMSSGRGALSRLYRTTDGCKTWKLIFTNPDPAGFWDAIRRTKGDQLYVLGDPVNAKFAMFLTEDAGGTWYADGEDGRDALPGDSAFAASNSALSGYDPYLIFGTGGTSSAHVYTTGAKCSPPPGHPDGPAIANCVVGWSNSEAPVASGTAASGIFSLAVRPVTLKNGIPSAIVVAVGGVYDQPDQSSRTAATSSDGGKTWASAVTPPHGYRSAVGYDAASKTWITVGPNGTDVSTDDGRNWRALRPSAGEAADADQHWNALSLPFVVGPKGRIGKVRADALKAVGR